MKRPVQGTAHHLDEPRKIDIPAPRVSRYVSGANAHRVNQRQPHSPEPGEKSGISAGAGPRKGSTGK